MLRRRRYKQAEEATQTKAKASAGKALNRKGKRRRAETREYSSNRTVASHRCLVQVVLLGVQAHPTYVRLATPKLSYLSDHMLLARSRCRLLLRLTLLRCFVCAVWPKRYISKIQKRNTRIYEKKKNNWNFASARVLHLFVSTSTFVVEWCKEVQLKKKRQC